MYKYVPILQCLIYFKAYTVISFNTHFFKSQRDWQWQEKVSWPMWSCNISLQAATLLRRIVWYLDNLINKNLIVFIHRHCNINRLQNGCQYWKHWYSSYCIFQKWLFMLTRKTLYPLVFLLIKCVNSLRPWDQAKLRLFSTQKADLMLNSTQHSLWLYIHKQTLLLKWACISETIFVYNNMCVWVYKRI